MKPFYKMLSLRGNMGITGWNFVGKNLITALAAYIFGGGGGGGWGGGGGDGSDCTYILCTVHEIDRALKSFFFDFLK